MNKRQGECVGDTINVDFPTVIFCELYHRFDLRRLSLR